VERDAELWYLSNMRIGFAFGRILAVLAIVGLTLAPGVRSAMAVPVAIDVSSVAVDAIIADASDDMPCCPSKPALPDCSKDCPLMALCVTAPIHFVSQTGLIVVVTFVAVVFSGARSDLVSIAQPPPRRPPKA
jgi:hypothetical protein